MKKNRPMLLLFVLMLMTLSLIPLGTAYAQDFERTPIDDSIDQVSSLMENTFEMDPAAIGAWEDYVDLLKNAEYQDYTVENATEMGSTHEEISEFFSPDAVETIIEFTEFEIEYVYTYTSETLDQLSIHLYVYNDGLYGTAFISNVIDITDDQIVSLDEIEDIIAAGWPKISVLEEAEPTVFGVLNMVKDEQLGSIVAFASGDSADEATLEFVSYEADMPTSTWYFTNETYKGINDGTLKAIPDQLVFYAVEDFIPSFSLRELVNRNTAENIGYRIANEQMTILLDQFVMRGLEDNVSGSTLEEVQNGFEVDAEVVELELEEPLTGLVYRFEDPNNTNNLGVLTVYFYDDQFAFTSVENVEAGWNNASVAIDYSQGITEEGIHSGETITYLTQTPMQVPAVGVMMRSSRPHLVAVIPVKDSEGEVLFVDIHDYHIENYSVQEVTESTGELSDDLFNYIFEQY